MKTFVCFVLAALLVACGTPAPQEPRPGAAAPPPPMAIVEPGSSLLSQGIPPIPLSLMNEVSRYTDFRGHSFIEWHPTRREMLVAFRKGGGSTQIFRLASPLGELEPLTAFSDPVFSATYEPREGKYIVFSRDADGSAAHQLYRMDLETRRTTLLTDPSESNRIEGWLHRSSKLLVSSVAVDRLSIPGTSSPVATHQTLSLVDPDRPTAPRKLVRLEGTGWGVGGVSWDDRRVALNRRLSAQESQVWMLELASGKLTQILPAPGSRQRFVHLAGSFKKDNSGLYVVTDRESEFRELMLYRFADKRFTAVTRQLRWDVTGGATTHDGKLIALRSNVDGREELRLFNAQSFKEQPPPQTPAGSVIGVDFHRKLDELAFTVNNARGPSQIFSIYPGSGMLVQWTKTHGPFGMDTVGFSDQQIVRWKSFDGRTISGLLTLPPKRFTGPRPVLVAIHGGPDAQAQMGFMGRYNYLLNELGIAIIEPNVRGSSGYGRSFLALDDGRKRMHAVRDVGALLDWIATQPQLDAQRVLVSGGSYGGYVALAVSQFYSPGIAGTVSVAGISNFVSFLRNVDVAHRDRWRAEYGDERDPEMRAFLQEISPLTNAHRIRKPLLLVQGKNDPWVPYSETEQVVAAARGENTPVWYLLAADEGHGFARPDNADYQFYATVMFLQHTLLAPPAAAGTLKPGPRAAARQP